VPQKVVSVFTLGGTISAGGRDGRPRLSGEQILAGVPSPHGVVLELCDFRRVPSSSLTIEDLAELAQRIDEVTARGDGVVVVQGTDTIEETAFLLDLLCQAEAPIVVTGAMRKPDLPGADGPANLAAAIAVAAAPSCHGLGVLVVMADEIHAARHVHKTHTTSVATFASPGLGPLGLVVEGEPRILLKPSRPSVSTPLRLRRTVTVGLITLALGDRGEMLEVARDRFDGLVVAGFGAGHVPSWLVGPLAALAADKPVVLASRTGSGPLLRDTYHGPGSESDLARGGLISAGFFDPAKARLLLYGLLADGSDRARVAATFAELTR
jgi:L-asparaginase